MTITTQWLVNANKTKMLIVGECGLAQAIHAERTAIEDVQVFYCCLRSVSA